MQHHITIPRPVARFILTRGSWLVTAVLALTFLASWQIWRTPVSISALESFTADSRTFEQYRERAELFGGDSDMLVFVATEEGDHLFTPMVLNAIRSASKEMATLPEVEQVVALTDVVLIGQHATSDMERFGRNVVRQQLLSGQDPAIPKNLSLPAWWPESQAEQAQVDLNSMRQSLLTDRFVSRRLISADGRSHCMLIRLIPDSMSLGAKWKLRNRLSELVREHGLGAGQLHISGLTVSEGWILVELVSCLRYQLPLGGLIIGLIVFGMYRSLSIAGLTLVVGAIASVWAVSITGLVFGKITVLVAAVPLLILVISTSDTIHIVSAYCKEFSSSLGREEALIRVIQDVGGACVLTSLTTLVGFMSLLLIPVTAIRHLAVTAGAGVALALVLAISLVPIGITWLNFSPDSSSKRSPGFLLSMVSYFLSMCRWISMTFPRSVVTIHLVGLAVAVSFSLHLKFDPNLTERFHSSHPMPVSVSYFNKNFSGTNVVELFISGDPSSLLSPENLERIGGIRERLLEMPEVHSVSCPNDLFALVHQAIDYQTPTGLPPNPTAAMASLRLLEGFQPDLVRAVVAPGAMQFRITAYTTLNGFFEVLELSTRIGATVEAQLQEELKVDVSGFMPVIAKSVETIVDSQLTGLTFCFSVVLIIVIIALRSVRLGLISLLPNVFPLIMLAGFLAAISPTIDSDFIIVFTIAFGIAVDDTIHFLHRYDVEFSLSKSRRTAVESAYHYSGRAIVQTTLVLGLGLLPLAMSNYLTIWMLGTYLGMTLVLAVLADLLLLPALILLFDTDDE